MKNVKIKVNRQSVCMADDMTDHIKVYQLKDNATYKTLFHILKKDKYFPNVSTHNSVWVLTNYHYHCIFSYFTKTNHLSMGIVEQKLKNICQDSYDVYLQYYSSPKEWKKKIESMYEGDTYSLWRDGWLDEIKYCEYVMTL